jgi:CheY-like chemotaxis protein
MFIRSGIVDLHKGFISATSDGEGKGTTFFVDLPLTKRNLSSIRVSRRPASQPNSFVPNQPLRPVSGKYASSNGGSSTGHEDGYSSVSIRDSNSSGVEYGSVFARSFSPSSGARSSRAPSAGSHSSTPNNTNALVVERTTIDQPHLRKISEAPELRSTSELIDPGSCEQTVMQPVHGMNVDQTLLKHDQILSSTPLPAGEAGNLNETTIFQTTSNIQHDAQISPAQQKNNHGTRQVFGHLWRLFSSMGDRYQADELDIHDLHKLPGVNSLSSSDLGQSPRGRVSSINAGGSSLLFFNHPVKFWLAAKEDNDLADNLSPVIGSDAGNSDGEDLEAGSPNEIHPMDSMDDVPPFHESSNTGRLLPTIVETDEAMLHRMNSGGLAPVGLPRPRSTSKEVLNGKLFSTHSGKFGQIVPTVSLYNRDEFDSISNLPLHTSVADNDRENALELHTESVESSKDYFADPLFVSANNDSTVANRRDQDCLIDSIDDSDFPVRYVPRKSVSTPTQEFTSMIDNHNHPFIYKAGSHDEARKTNADNEVTEKTHARAMDLLSLSIDKSESVDGNELLSGAQRWAKGLSILVVDDASTNRKMLARLLTSVGHTVKESVDGVDCINIVTSRMHSSSPFFDVILIDDNMPHLNGSDAVKIIRELGYNGIVYGVTGDIFPETIKRFTDQGANRVLAKPVKLNELKSKLLEDL